MPFSNFFFRCAILCTLLLSAGSAMAELRQAEARKLITRLAGGELPSSAVRITQITQVSPDTAEVTAQVETAFRFEQEQSGHWTVREVRVAPDRWEDVSTIARAVRTTLPVGSCQRLEESASDESELSVKRARCTIAGVLDVQLPSDAVRIKQVSPMTLPLASQPSSLVVATLQAEFRFTSTGGKAWKISDIRIGNRNWVTVVNLIAALDEAKKEAALNDLQTLAAALQKFRSERGFYVTSDQQRVLIDHLTPRYLSRVIRVDPWHNRYQYAGEPDRFTLRSGGPDGETNTADDLVLTSQ